MTQPIHFSSAYAGSAPKNATIQSEYFSFYPDHGRLLKGNEEISLNAIELSLLTYLLHHPNQWLKTDTIFRDVWAERNAAPPVVKSTVTALRQKLGDTGKVRILIEGKRSLGYRFIGIIQPLSTKIRSTFPDDSPEDEFKSIVPLVFLKHSLKRFHELAQTNYLSTIQPGSFHSDYSETITIRERRLRPSGINYRTTYIDGPTILCSSFDTDLHVHPSDAVDITTESQGWLIWYEKSFDFHESITISMLFFIKTKKHILSNVITTKLYWRDFHDSFDDILDRIGWPDKEFTDKLSNYLSERIRAADSAT